MPQAICILPGKECWRCQLPIPAEEDIAWRHELTGVSRHWYWGTARHYELVPFHYPCAMERLREKQQGWALLIGILIALLLPFGLLWIGAAAGVRMLWRNHG